MVKTWLLAFFILFLAFVGLNSVRESYSASNQYLGAKDCKAEANWALMLLKDKIAGIPLNVMPADQHVLDLVEAHRGTRDELWWKTYNACSGVKT